ncbi:conserved protein of unknown function [Candidatus Filomicrobium marinum]|uniref:Uncharacterized protein n=1 Tax=Candidatus Filomicrobium marinum TaxID=1608628 RepID=A0A0D6JFV9_9HYPH|nr:hypothetical protein [Candidatus Filomicrobium marinum]CFX24196.1 conserved protein of unknown function [Candidatus Filomicrobium marinum]CPR19138.1 conserved protein of unknown function [Candidatus Filomicrobium marinum]
MSNDNESKRPSHIAYQVREGEENKSYFNRIGSVWPHKDGEGYNIQLDAVPVDGRITIRSVQERIQEAKESSRGGDRRDERRSETSRSGREDRQSRDNAPRYER